MNDPSEPNDDERAPLSPEQPVQASLCPGADADSYVFHLDAGQAFRLDCTFAHADGDVDLGVALPGAQDFAFVSDSSDDDESVSGVAPVSGDYLALVQGYQGATNPAYTLTLHVMAADACTDAAEGAGGNNDAAHAAPLRAHLDEQLQICAGDEDFLTVDLEAGQHATLTARFHQADGDLDAELVAPDGQTWLADSADDDEIFDLDPVPATGPYLLRLYGYAGATNTYTLILEERAAAPCEADRVEPNDSRDDAEPFAPQAYNDLSFCGEPDWFKTQVGAGEALVVFLGFDAPAAPELLAFDAAGSAIADTDVAVAGAGEGCRAARAHCLRVTVRPPAPGWVAYQIAEGQRGMTYDLTVRAEAGQGAGQCGPGNETCGDFAVCDYPNRTCEAVYCDDVFPCPGDYLCHQNWCVGLCNNDAATCPYAGYTCKTLDDFPLCGLAGDGAVGDACFDFTDCGGTLDCLNDPAVPGGYCSRACAADADCDGSPCVDFDGGRFCAKRCASDAACRAGYTCATRAAVAGGTARVCEPGP